jgi:hypothetical protein
MKPLLALCACAAVFNGSYGWGTFFLWCAWVID